jgi:hypothetical protein
MRTELAIVCLVAALLGATAAHAQSQPTASEIFDLRTKCRQLSKQLLTDVKSGYDDGEFISEESNYSPKKNRCFTKITILVPKKGSVMYEMWDAQDNRRQAIAWHTKSEKEGYVYDKTGNIISSAYDLALNYIDQIMKDDN